jgi:hypothetical protein
VKSINTLKDDVTLTAGSNVTITPSGNTLTIAATGGGGTSLWATNGNSISNTNTGYVGIGTIAPTRKLHVEGGNCVAVRGYSQSGYGVFGSSNSFAGYFSGNVHVNGTLSKTAGAFKIDHPLDPTNKYLYHSFVESPDMKNIYDGVVTLDANGEADVQLPEWFEALNKDFRYQLTSIGAPGPNLYIAHEISGNSFQIGGGIAATKVSWQVTGIRHDPFAEQHRIPVEEMKTGKEAGKYLYPKEHGVSESLGMDYEELMQIQAEMKKNQERKAIRLGERTEEKNK